MKIASKLLGGFQFLAWVAFLTQLGSSPALAQSWCPASDGGLVVTGSSGNISGPSAINELGLMAFPIHPGGDGVWRLGLGDGLAAVSLVTPYSFDFRVFAFTPDRLLVGGKMSCGLCAADDWNLALRDADGNHTAVSSNRANEAFGDANMANEVVFYAPDGIFYSASGSPEQAIPLPVGYVPNAIRPRINSAGDIVAVAARIGTPSELMLGNKDGLLPVVAEINGAPLSPSSEVFLAERTSSGSILFAFIHGDTAYRYLGGDIKAIAEGVLATGVAINAREDVALVGRILPLPDTLWIGDAGSIDPATDAVLSVGESFDGSIVSRIDPPAVNAVGQFAMNLGLGTSLVNRQVRYDPPGTTQCNPVLPGPCPDAPVLTPRFCFRDIRDGWVDPPLAIGYEYHVVGDGHFTSIEDFPLGFENEFSIIADGVEIPGSFGPGDSVQFSPPGVSTFAVLGVSPGIDSSRSDAFPLRISSDRPLIDFDMFPIASDSSCPPLPRSGCRLATKSLVDIRFGDDVRHMKFLWKWLKGDLPFSALGDPTNEDDYGLCIYSGTNRMLRAGVSLPAGDDWTANGKTIKLKSGGQIQKVSVKSGQGGAAKAIVKGKGLGSPLVDLPLTLPVVVQLARGDGSLCLESTFAAMDEPQNDGQRFKARSR